MAELKLKQGHHGAKLLLAEQEVASDQEVVLGDFALTDGELQPTGALPDESISNAELALMPANSVKVNATDAEAAPADIEVAANEFLARASTGDLEPKAVSDFGLSVLDDTTAAAARTTLGAAPSISWQPQGTFPTYGQLALFEGREDFLHTGDAMSGGLQAQQSGAGSGLSGAGSTLVTGRVGVVQASTGTDAAGRTCIVTLSPAFEFGQGRCRTRTDARLSALSDGTDTYTVRIGFGDSFVGEHVDGAFFRYTHSVAAGNWECVTRSNDVETATDSGVAATASGALQVFEVEVNAAGTSAAFYINGVLVATHSTNIPIGNARQTGLVTGIIKSAGTTSRGLFIDLMAWSFEPTSAL